MIHCKMLGLCNTLFGSNLAATCRGVGISTALKRISCTPDKDI